MLVTSFTGHCTQFLAGETWIHLQIAKQVTYFVNFLQFPVNNIGLVLFSNTDSLMSQVCCWNYLFIFAALVLSKSMPCESVKMID